jgi:hypothetical protein
MPLSALTSLRATERWFVHVLDILGRERDLEIVESGDVDGKAGRHAAGDASPIHKWPRL